MDFLFYKALPEAPVEWPENPADAEPDFTFVALENTLDPDAKNHTGFNFFGAFGIGSSISAWAATQPLQEISKDKLPSPVTFYPDPFTEA